MFVSSIRTGVYKLWPMGHTQLPAFIDKVLLANSYIHVFTIACVCFCATMTDLSSWGRDLTACKA